MKKDSTPLACLFGFQNGKKITFVGRDGYIDAEGPVPALKQILPLCNGYNTCEEIKRLLRKIVAPIEIDEILAGLELLGAVVDSKELYKNFHEDSSNPSRFPSNVSLEDLATLQSASLQVQGVEALDLSDAEGQILSGLLQRHTIRSFEDRAIAKKILAGLLMSMYGQFGFHSTPSAGGLYPLRVFVSTLSDKQLLGNYWYEYDPRTLHLMNTGREVKKDDLYQALDAKGVLNDCSLIVQIVADLERPAVKYGNRAYRFALIETGHVAQNAAIFCAQHGLGILEFGGFSDRVSSEMLGLNYPGQAVLMTLFIGFPSDTESEYIKQFFGLARLKAMVGVDKPIRSFSVSRLEYKSRTIPGFAGFAILASGDRTFARGQTVTETGLKVLAEAYERSSSMQYRIDLRSPASKLAEPWLDPRTIFPQHKSVSKPFEEKTEWEWVIGTRQNGETVLVPVDLVFYPLGTKQLGRRACAPANSSGVAAHFDESQSKTRALLELIERDAIMVTWHSRRNVTAIPREFWPANVKTGAKLWEKEGRTVRVLNFTLDSVPVAVVVIHSDRYPCLVSGAAADFDWGMAISKAYEEAEFMLVSWMKHRVRRVNPRKLAGPRDHGILYFFPDFMDEVRWILEAKEEIPLLKGGDIFQIYNPVFVRVGDRDQADLKVFRALSESLMPIHFSFGREAYRHRRLKMLGLEWRRTYPAFPHFFA